GLTVRKQLLPSTLPASPPPSLPIAPLKSPPATQVQYLVAADSAPVDSPARSTLHNSLAPARRPPPLRPVSAPLALPLAHADITPPPRSSPLSHSPPAADSARLHSPLPSLSPAHPHFSPRCAPPAQTAAPAALLPLPHIVLRRSPACCLVFLPLHDFA